RRHEAAARYVACIRTLFRALHSQPRVGGAWRPAAAAVLDPVRTPAQAHRRDARLSAWRGLQRVRPRTARPAGHVWRRWRWLQPDRRAAYGRDRAPAGDAGEPGRAAFRTRPARHVLDRDAVADPDLDCPAVRAEHPSAR